jgi:ribosomal-protein-alanine N-acetyltransferase
LKRSGLCAESFRLRTFTADDLNRVMTINFECLPENYSSYFYRELFTKYPETFIVAEADNDIQGYIMCRMERGFSKLKAFTPSRLLHVVSLAVREPYRRRGIAKNIMIKAMKNGVNHYQASECYLEVRVGNIPAINLYENLDFTKTKRNYSYYMDGEDAWLMAKPLTDE